MTSGTGHGPWLSVARPSWLPLLLLLSLAFLGSGQESRFLSVPCTRLFPSMVPMLRPCSCYLIGPPDNGTGINCDRIAFQGNFPLLPYRQRIYRFSQRHAGVQDLESQLFTASGIPLRVLDLSHNRIRRLADRMLEGVQVSLEELHLGFNLLGDQLSPVFASNELRRLRELKLLDLSYNLIQGIDSGVFKGLEKLEVLHINGNSFEDVPSSSLVDLPGLTWLSLDENRIAHLPKNGFPQLSSLQTLNLTNNKIANVEDGAFANLPSIQILLMGKNRLKSLSTGAFDGLNRLAHLDISDNFMANIPVATLRRLPSLRILSMSACKIRSFSGALPSDLKSQIGRAHV